MKYSVITPVFNSFHLMMPLLKSLEEQTFTDFELILVDDCSSDGSYDCLLSYSKKTSINVIVLKTEVNQGPGEARNLGLRHSTGQWVCFVDNDDWVDKSLLEKMNEIQEKFNVECIAYDYFKVVREIPVQAESLWGCSGGVLSNFQALGTFQSAAHAKCIKKELINREKICYPNLRRCEDLVFFSSVLGFAKGIYYLKLPLYYYYQRKGSLSSNENLGERDIIEAHRLIQNNLGRKYPFEVKKRSIYDYFYSCVLNMIRRRENRFVIERFIDTFEEGFQDWFTSKYLGTLKLGQKIFLGMIHWRLLGLARLLIYLREIIRR